LEASGEERLGRRWRVAKADKIRRKTRATARAEIARVRRASADEGAAPKPAKTPKYQRHESGLQLLSRTGKLGPAQVAAGMRYGQLWRDAQLQPGCFRSSMTSLLSVGPSAGGDDPTDLLSAEQLVQVRRELAQAQMALGFADDLIGVCDVICGKQWTPGMVSAVRRDQEAYATLLFSALTTLAKHFAAAKANGLSGPASVAA